MIDRRKVLQPVTQKRLPITTYTPTTSNQTIKAGSILLGDQTVAGDADLVAGNIKSGVTIFDVLGTYASSGAWTNPSYFSGDQNSAIINLNYSGGGIAYIYQGTAYGGILTPVFFTTSLTSDAGGRPTVDGVTLNASTLLYGYGKNQSLYNYFSGDLATAITSLSYSGAGIAYVEDIFYSGGVLIPFFFNTSLATSAGGVITIDGVAFNAALNLRLRGYGKHI